MLIMENQIENAKNGHGGRRDGAGRPKTIGNTRSIGIRVPEDVAQILDAQPNRSAFIIAAIRAYAAQNK